MPVDTITTSHGVRYYLRMDEYFSNQQFDTKGCYSSELIQEITEFHGTNDIFVTSRLNIKLSVMQTPLIPKRAKVQTNVNSVQIRGSRPQVVSNPAVVENLP